jgi:hypothetical protein
MFCLLVTALPGSRKYGIDDRMINERAAVDGMKIYE